MPGPPLSKTFTYDGTPGQHPGSAPFNTLDRIVVQSNRQFLSKQIGTHSKVALSVDIPQNSGKGTGAGSGQYNIDADNAAPADELA